MSDQNPLAKAPPSLIIALYLAAGFLVVGPFLYEAQRLFPAEVNDVHWRFGAGGFLLGAVTTPLLGLALATLLAYLRGFSRPQRLVALLTGVFAAGLLAVLVVFISDLQGMVRSIPVQAAPVVRATAIRTILGAATAALAAIALVLGGIAAARQAAAGEAQ